jgi:hypothetical protein
MSFRPDAAEMCLDGRKTRTRRISECAMTVRDDDGNITALCAWRGGHFVDLWRVGKSIAIKPKRTAKAVGRVMCTGLRVEHVQDITEEDARREGVDDDWKYYPGKPRSYDRSYVAGFTTVWMRLNPYGPYSWSSNPLVVVIEFRPLKEGEV